MAQHPFEPTTNRLLAALLALEPEGWPAELQRVELPLGKVLHEPHGPLAHAYFPTTAIVSLLYRLEDGASAEIAVIGNEGFVGASHLLSQSPTLSHVVVQSAGEAWRLGMPALQREFVKGGAAMGLLLRYVQALLVQISQTAVCNRHHSIHQQLCRWLLLSLDRLPNNRLVMTQDLIASMLGVQRAGVTQAAVELQQSGLIRYARGRITVLDRAGLEAASCECYGVVKKEYDRLLG